MRKSKFRKTDVVFLRIEESSKVIWAWGVPKKGSDEYGIEYLFFQFQFKDRRRHGLMVYIDKGEMQAFKKVFKLVDKHYKKHPIKQTSEKKTLR